MSFRLKTILGIALIESILLLILIISGLNFLSDSNEKQLQQRAQSTVKLFASATKDAVLATDLATLESFVDEMLTNPDVVYTRIISNSRVLAQKGDKAILATERIQDTSLETVTDNIYDVKSEIVVEGQLYGSIELGLSTTFIDQLLITAKSAALGLAGIEVTLVAIFSFMLGTYLTRQLGLLKKASETISKSGPGHQVEISGHDEIAEVAASFNQMSNKLQKSYSDLHDTMKDYKKMARIAHRNEAMNKAIISSSQDAIITIDIDACIIEFNHVAEHIFGWDKKQVTGKNLAQIILPESSRFSNKNRLLRYLKMTEGSVRGKRMELEAINHQGKSFPIEVSISPIFNDDEILFTAFIRDLTKRKEAEAKQQLAHKQAELANEAKSRFLATMSHEIRSPLNAIMSMNTLLLETDLNEQQAELAQIANNGGEVLMSLINDILDFSKIESGKLNLHEDWFNLSQTTQRTVKLLSNQIHHKTISVETHISKGVHSSYFGDKPRIRQILINLLSNAIKFTESGIIKVSLDALPDLTGIKITVTDSGIGIDEEHLKNIFNEFSQVEDSDNRRYGGTGLGLSIVSRLVKKMNGTVSVTSQKKSGSKFTIQLPLPGRDTQTEVGTVEIAVPIIENIKDKKILIAEDSPTNQIVIQTLLSNMGLKVTTANNGKQAISFAKKIKYDLILMDLAMPIMDGLEATRQIKNSPGKNQKTRIIAITANAFAEDRERCLAAGMDDFITKPIEVNKFQTKIPQWLQKKAIKKPVETHEQLIDTSVYYQLEKDTGKAILPKILNIFFSETNLRLPEMISFFNEKDWSKLGNEAHALKSSSGTFGAIKLQAIAREIELAAKVEDITSINQAVSALEKTATHSMQELSALLNSQNHG